MSTEHLETLLADDYVELMLETMGIHISPLGTRRIREYVLLLRKVLKESLISDDYCENAPDRPTAKICNVWYQERQDHNRQWQETGKLINYMKMRIEELEERLLQRTIAERGIVLDDGR